MRLAPEFKQLGEVVTEVKTIRFGHDTDGVSFYFVEGSIKPKILIR